MMNKKRLAALALSAVMATSTMSIPVYAADFSDGTAAEAEVQVQSDFSSDAAGEVQAAAPAEETVEAAGTIEDGNQITNLKFYYNDPDFDDFTVTYNIGTSDTLHTAEAVEWKREAATCKEPEKIWLKVTIDGQNYYSKDGFNVRGSSALGDAGHEWITTTDYIGGDKPSHNQSYTAVVSQECAICREQKDQVEKEMSPLPHEWSDPVYLPEGENSNVKTENGQVVFDSEGHAVLLDDTKDGYYKVVRYCTDPECEAERKTLRLDPAPAEDVEHKVEYSVSGKYAKITAYDKAHIKTNLVEEYGTKKFYNPTQQFALDEDDIELKDCTVGGWYELTYFNADDKPLSDKLKITVNPHHYNVYTTAEFENGVDKDQCTVSHDANGNLVVKNNSCYRTIEYYEVSHCQADGCNYKPHEVKYADREVWDASNETEQMNHDTDSMISKVKKEAVPVGEHVITNEAQDVYDEIAKWAKDGKLSKLLTYGRIVKIIDNTDYIKLSDAPDCSVGGTVTISYICALDEKTVVKTQEVKVVPTDHVRDIPEMENYVAPTCDKVGTYDAVTDCKYCGTELERRPVEIPRLTHTNEIKAEYDASGKYVNDYTTDTTAYLKFSGNKVVDTNGEALKNKGAVITDTFNFAIDKENNVKVPFAGKYAMEDTKEFRDDFGVKVWVYTKCAECGKHEIALNKDNAVVNDVDNDVQLKIVDVQKESANGRAGSITLEATYKIQTAGENKGKTIKEEITVPYFSTIEAYNGRLEEQPETPDEKLNGLHWDEDGECRYYVDGEFQKDFSGILEYEGKSFVLDNGVLRRTASGLTPIDDEWYYLTEGRIRTDVTQLVEYDGEWFFVTEGKLDTSVNDLVEYDGETFVFVDGRLAQEGNGLWVGKDDVWYFLSNGRVAEEHTGLAMYDNEWFYVVEGKIAVDYNGTVDFEGGTFKVVGGMVKEQVK